jgi:UDP-N-acetylmuramate: L-alanyl-gamma-D-glutamyl-meso-diaminopimelate ligase
VKRIHLIGVCGTAMATLAAMLKVRGFDVRGSDQGIYPPMSEFLAAQGITLLEGYRAEHITGDLDLVIVGNAISRGNPEVEEVLDRKIRYCSLPEALRDHFLWGARSIVIAGTHGKTTTASLAGWLLACGGADPSVFIGGIAGNFDSSFRLGGGRDFVLEGDEYDSAFFDKTAKFLKYLPDIAVIGNVEFDHADIYPDLEAVRVAFRRLVNLVPRSGLLVLGADSPEALALRPLARCRVETFGLAEDADWQADQIEALPQGTRFAVRLGGRILGAFELPLLGLHNVRNALAAMAVGAASGLLPSTMADGLQSFRGVRRRLEHRGTARGVDVYDDFAHHPTAIAETLNGIRSAFPGRRVWAVFEPRSATSCRRVFQADFARAFERGRADEVIIAAVYRSALPEAERLSPSDLVRDLGLAGVHARYLAGTAGIVETICREGRPGDLVVIMSNGGFDDVHRKILQALEASS